MDEAVPEQDDLDVVAIRRKLNNGEVDHDTVVMLLDKIEDDRIEITLLKDSNRELLETLEKVSQASRDIGYNLWNRTQLVEHLIRHRDFIADTVVREARIIEAFMKEEL